MIVSLLLHTVASTLFAADLTAKVKLVCALWVTTCVTGHIASTDSKAKKKDSMVTSSINVLVIKLGLYSDGGGMHGGHHN